MVTTPSFYNLKDQGIYAAGDFFIPQERYRAAPYNVNQPNNPDEVPAGIPTVYQPQGGGGGGGYTGGISDLTTSFQTAVDDRQDRLRSLNMPLEQKGVRGDDIIMENIGVPGIESMPYDEAQFGPVTIKGAPGVYQAGAKNTIGRKISDAFYSLPFVSKPQSADMIMEEGYTGKDNLPGIIGMMLGKMDQYGSLSRPDQAFIAANMGYTGPTVFGANNSGLNKDPFGLNVRSAFGNYAERVGKEATKIGDVLSATGKVGSKFAGATFNPATGMFELDDGSKLTAEQLADINKRTNMLRKKFQFYTQKTKERNEFLEAEKRRQEAAFQAQLNQQQRDQRQSDLNRIDRAYREETGGQGGSYATGESGVQSDGSYNDPFDPGGGEKDGGFIDGTNRRMDFMMGGLADLVDIYD